MQHYSYQSKKVLNSENINNNTQLMVIDNVTFHNQASDVLYTTGSEPSVRTGTEVTVLLEPTEDVLMCWCINGPVRWNRIVLFSSEARLWLLVEISTHFLLLSLQKTQLFIGDAMQLNMIQGTLKPFGLVLYVALRMNLNNLFL